MSGTKKMITVLYGQNNYMVRQKLQDMIALFPVKEAIERYDGTMLSPDRLSTILQGASLFSVERLVVITDASSSAMLWSALAEYIGTISKELHLVLVEEALDKRTKTYKQLQKFGNIHELKLLSETEAEQWLVREAASEEILLDILHVRQIVQRVGTDQWLLHAALEKLRFVEEITAEVIEMHTEVRVEANVFALIDATLAGNVAKVQQLVDESKQSQDPYQFFGLLSSQLFQLMTLALSKKSSSDVAKDLGVHPYPLQKVSGLASRLTAPEIQTIAEIVSECDDKIKRSGVEPWLLIEQALLKIAHDR